CAPSRVIRCASGRLVLWRPALGGAFGLASVLAGVAARYRAADRVGRRLAGDSQARPAPAADRARRPGAVGRPHQAAVGSEARDCAPSDAAQARAARADSAAAFAARSRPPRARRGGGTLCRPRRGRAALLSPRLAAPPRGVRSGIDHVSRAGRPCARALGAGLATRKPVCRARLGLRSPGTRLARALLERRSGGALLHDGATAGAVLPPRAATARGAKAP